MDPITLYSPFKGKSWKTESSIGTMEQLAPKNTMLERKASRSFQRFALANDDK